MIHKPYRTSAIPVLTVLVAALALTASVGGLFVPDLYNDSELIKKGWFANDLITIPLAILYAKHTDPAKTR